MPDDKQGHGLKNCRTVPATLLSSFASSSSSSGAPSLADFQPSFPTPIGKESRRLLAKKENFPPAVSPSSWCGGISLRLFSV